MLKSLNLGKYIELQQKYSTEEIESIQELLESNYEECIKNINDKIQRLKEEVWKQDPKALLQYVNWQEWQLLINLQSEFQLEAEDTYRLTEYVQSIYTDSSFKVSAEKKEVDEEKLVEIAEDIKEINETIRCFYWNLGAKLKKKFQNEESDVIDILMETQMMYTVRGQRYAIFEKEYFATLLAVHDEVLKELFGIDSQEIIKGMVKIHYALTQERIDILNRVHTCYEESMKFKKRLEEFQTTNAEEIKEFQDKFVGYDLYNLEKVTEWPRKFIEELSWRLGDERVKFFNEEEFSGWPVTELPIFKRPFIKIEGQYYCFDYYSLVDNFYRVLQKTVKRLKPSYKWSDQQLVASEGMVEKIFKTLLPGCQTYTSNYYGPKKSRAENDLLVQYDDTLIIVEVKAGGFVSTTPMTDFEAHLKSYKTLIEKASLQCKRMEEYIGKNTVVKLFNRQQEIKAEIDTKKIKKIYSMSVTIDNMNILAAKAEKIAFLHMGENSISIGVDDLMVYRNYFDSPLLFLHFLHQRYLATKDKKIALNDELDHLGMYIEHNCYPLYVQTLPPGNLYVFGGYREKIDNYFSSLANPSKSVPKPTQDIPKLFMEIIKTLEKSNIQGKSKLANYFLDFSGDAKEQFSTSVYGVLNRQKELLRAIPITTTASGEEGRRYTCYVNREAAYRATPSQKREYVLAALYLDQDDGRCLIDLYFDNNNRLESVNVEKFQKKDIKEEEKDKVILRSKEISYLYKEKIKKQYHRKIGRNEKCPCGSGLKYKKCCGK